MNILDKILGWFSPEARRTYELSQLNAIWRRFNAGEDPEEIEMIREYVIKHNV